MAKWNKDGLEVSSIKLGEGNLSEGINGDLTWNGNNILTSSNDAEKNKFIGMPDYSAGVSMINGTQIVPVDALCIVESPLGKNVRLYLKVNGTSVYSFSGPASVNSSGCGSCFVQKGATVEISGAATATYYPLFTE